MACFLSTSERDAGYATAAALVLCLSLSLVVTATVARSAMILRLSKADLEKTKIEYALDGAQLQAAAVVIRGGAGGPYRWQMETDGGWAEVLVESEAEKLSFAAGANLPAEALAAFAVADPAALKARLHEAVGQSRVDVSMLDDAPLWRSCSASLISRFGRRDHVAPMIWRPPPTVPPEHPGWRVGEPWRIRVTTSTGWRDDRIVRFTGDADHPTAVVARRLSRTHRGHVQCDTVIAAAV